MKLSAETINEIKTCFFEEINKIYKPLARLTCLKRDSMQLTNMKSERGAITTDLTGIIRMIKEYYASSKT